MPQTKLVLPELEEEAYRLQRIIGREVKRGIIAECKEKGWKIPKFGRII